MIRRFAVLALSTSLVVTFIAAAPAAAVSSAPIPTSMAAVGDSITQAASTGGSLGADAPQNSWSTGTSSTVNSHFLRLRAQSPNLVAHNRSVSGAKVANLKAQMDTVVALSPDPGYVTVLIGGNDLCTDTVEQMTSVDDFRDHFTAAMTTIKSGSPDTYVYVVSIPDVWQLWNLFKGSFWARFIWSSADICQSLLANPTSNQTADVERRRQVQERNVGYNNVMEQVCESPTFAARCHFDNHAVFNAELTRNDVSGDYFHPSVAGQAKLASVSWGAGYTWATTTQNQPPTASFTHDCTDLFCSFADASTDGDGTIASRSWTFGDGGTSTATNPSHTYTAAGTYAVSLTVVDDDGAPASTSRNVTVTEPSEPPSNEGPTADFTFSCSDLACNFTDASADGDGTIASRSWAFGDGGTSTATNPSHTYTVGGTYTVTLTVTDDDDATDSDSQSVTVTAPPTGVTLTVSAYKVRGVQHADLTWSGAASTNVDVFRNGAKITTTANDEFHTDTIGGRGGGSYTYRVCEAGTTTCSAEVTASY